MENLENILESILFTNGDAVDISDITSKIDVTKAEINKAVNKLKSKYNENSGIVLLTFNNKLQLASSGKYANEVSLVLNPIRQRNLSKATLETASIVAYKQPVTRMEIEEVRGVSSDYAINILLEHNLIEIVGRKDTVGKPVLFGTTDEFLKRFNLSSIDELPDYNTLLEKVKIIEHKDDRLYNHFEVKPEDESATSAINPEDLEPVIGETYEEDFKPSPKSESKEKKSKNKSSDVENTEQANMKNTAKNSEKINGEFIENANTVNGSANNEKSTININVIVDDEVDKSLSNSDNDFIDNLEVLEDDEFDIDNGDSLDDLDDDELGINDDDELDDFDDFDDDDFV